MRWTVPSGRVADHVTFAMPSSRGGDPYMVSVIHPGNVPGIYGVMCPCEGYRHRGRCRHSRAVHGWLTALVPPRELPS